MPPQDLEHMVHSNGLMIMGTTAARVLIGTDAHWWDHFQVSPEFLGQVPDPVDTWSKRVLRSIAEALEVNVVFPSDGPPYAPFIAWALETHRFWLSPTGMLIHDRAGLMISIRGALELSISDPKTKVSQSPCQACETRPCVSACPVSALAENTPYDVPRCKAYLDSSKGQACMSGGCLVRRACPISNAFGRPDVQSAFHMRAFKK